MTQMVRAKQGPSSMSDMQTDEEKEVDAVLGQPQRRIFNQRLKQGMTAASDMGVQKSIKGKTRLFAAIPVPEWPVSRRGRHDLIVLGPGL
jgi:hypothetical protein